ncbi:MAG: hypothetical protein ACR2NN_03475 [Bryobacteraceae bacterium]
MHEYDVTLKLLLRGPAPATLRELTGVFIRNWLDVELPKFHNPRVDLLGEAPDGSLIHMDLQSGNDSRMAEYAFGVYRLFDQFPRQILVYVGEARLQMPTQLKGPRLLFEYEIVDFTIWMESGFYRAKKSRIMRLRTCRVIAVLARFRDREIAVREIVGKLSGLRGEWREFYLSALLTLAGLRKLEEVVEEEARKVPILNDILEHKVLGASSSAVSSRDGSKVSSRDGSKAANRVRARRLAPCFAA